LQQYVATETGEWFVKGFTDVYKNIYTISSDTKIVSKILEIHIFSQIIQFAEETCYNSWNWWRWLHNCYKINETQFFKRT
jgi:hypothetical protein